eukprot:3532006-Pyramimonas_sp.AAC.1
MQHWLGRVYSKRGIRHLNSLHQVSRDDRGKIARANRGRGAKSAAVLEKRDAKKGPHYGSTRASRT